MIVLNGVVVLALLLGALRHGESRTTLQGAVAYLAIIVPPFGDRARSAQLFYFVDIRWHDAEGADTTNL